MGRPRKVQPADKPAERVETPPESSIPEGAQADKAERLAERQAASGTDDVQGHERAAEGVDTGSGQRILGIFTDDRQQRDGRPEDWKRGSPRGGLERALPSEPPLEAQPSPAIGEDAEIMAALQAAREGTDEKWRERNTPTNWNPEQVDYGREPEDAEVDPAEQPKHIQDLGVRTWTEGTFNEGDVPGNELGDDELVRIGADEIAANVGRNSQLEPARLVRREESGSGEINPALRFNPSPDDAQTEGAPANELSRGRRHDPDAPWPAPLSFASAAPSASPEPGPEPDYQYNPPQPVVFSDNPSAAVGTVGPSREEAQARAFSHLDYDAERVERAKRVRELEQEAQETEAGRRRAMEKRDEQINREIEKKAAEGKGTRAAAERILQAWFQGEGDAATYRKFRAAMVQAEREVRGQGWARAQRRHAPK